MRPLAEELAIFAKVPLEELIELYLEAMVEFAEIKRKPDEKAKEILRKKIKTKANKLYKNVGVDLNKEVLKITKNLNQNNNSVMI